MYNFFQNAEISIDYEFDNIEIPSNFKTVIEKKYIFVTPHTRRIEDSYMSNPYEHQNNYTQLDEDISDEFEENYDEIRVERFEKELLKNSQQTKTTFHPNGKFETCLPTGELYENKFDDNSFAPYYLEELNSGFGNINGFKIEYIDKTTNTVKKWLAVFDKDNREYHLHNLEEEKQVDSKYKGSQKDFKSLIKNIIQNSIDHELISATFYQ